MITFEERAILANERFTEGWTCAQAVLGGFCEDLLFDIEKAKALSSGFAGGMRYGETCGVVTAAIMVIGLWSAQQAGDEAEQKMLCYNTVSRFLQDFGEAQNGLNCRDIIGYDIRDSEERKRHPGQQASICPGVIRCGIRILADCMIQYQ